MNILIQNSFAAPEGIASVDEPLIVHRRARSYSSRALFIFVHGLGGARYGPNATWGAFPQFCFEDFGDADIGLYSYRTLLGRLRFWDSVDIPTESHTFADVLRLTTDYERIVLLGHSLGGLLCKAAIAHLLRCGHVETLTRIRGLILMATPQTGSQRTPRWLSWASADLRVLRPFSNFVLEIHDDLQASLAESGRQVVETWAVLGNSDVWVDRLSAGLGIPAKRKILIRGSHTSIVKPGSKESDGYLFVAAALKSINEQSDGPAVDHANRPARPAMLPRDISTFTGRTAQIRSLSGSILKVDTSGGCLAIDAINGMPGIGKTALAVHLAHELSASYTDGQIFIDLHAYTPGRKAVLPFDALSHLLSSLGVPQRGMPDSLDGRAALWRDSVSALALIVVLDNAKDYAQIEQLLPGGNRSCVLITSRQRMIGLEGATHLSLDVLPEPEALQMLALAAGRPYDLCDTNHGRSVVELCGYLPLAIRIVGGRWRRHSTWAVSDVLLKLSATRTRLEALSVNSVEVAAAFGLSYAELLPEQQTMFRALGAHPGTGFSAESAAALYGCDVDLAGQLLEQLFDQSLLAEPSANHYNFHDLLRDYARASEREHDSDAVRQQRRRRLLRFYADSLENADSQLDPHRVRIANHKFPAPFCISFPNAKNALTWCNAERMNVIACIELAFNISMPLMVCRLARAATHVFHITGHNLEGVYIHRLALVAAKMCASKDHEAWARFGLAQAYQASGVFDGALSHYQSALDIWESRHDSDGLASTLAGIGFTFERTGQYDDALVFLDRALTIRQTSGDLYGQAHAMNALGAVRWRLQDYPTAMVMFKGALAIRRELNDVYGQSRTANNIGFTYQRLGDYRLAISWLRDALVMAREAGDRNSETVTLNNLGYTFASLAQTDLAEAYASGGLDLARRVGSIYEEGRALDALGRAAAARSDVPLARKLWTDSLRMFETAGVPEGEEIRDLLRRLG